MTTAVETIRTLFAHAAWANRAVLEQLRTTPGTDPHALDQFAHLLAAENVWLTRIIRQPQAVPVWPTLTIDECATLAATNEAGFTALLDEMDALERDCTYTNSAGKTFNNRVVDILLHVAMHGMYHRGMTSILTRRSGGTPVGTDFIAYIRGVPTATRVDAERRAN